MANALLPFMHTIISELELNGYSQCFTHAHTIREQKEIAYLVSVCTGKKMTIELNVGLVEVVL